MIINLKHNYFIEVDEKNFTLCSEYISKKKNEKRTRTHGYYSSLESALKNYIRLATLDVNDGQVIELQEVLEQIKIVCNETIETIKNDFIKKEVSSAGEIQR